MVVSGPNFDVAKMRREKKVSYFKFVEGSRTCVNDVIELRIYLKECSRKIEADDVPV